MFCVAEYNVMYNSFLVLVNLPPGQTPRVEVTMLNTEASLKGGFLGHFGGSSERAMYPLRAPVWTLQGRTIVAVGVGCLAS